MSNRTIRILDLEGNALNDVSVSKISNALVHNESLEFLCLDFNDLGQYGTRAITSMLQRNRSLKELHLFGNQIDSVGATALANSLRHNSRDWSPPNLFSISISSLYVKEQSFILLPASQQ